MKVLIVGGGGREHALAEMMAKYGHKVFCAPGNDGIDQVAKCVNIKPDDIQGLINYVLVGNIDLTVVGPESPLAGGIVDEFEKAGLTIFGTNKEAARLESSKIFASQFRRRHNIPAPGFKVFSNHGEAKKYLESRIYPCVVKADGLAGGKGVFVCKTREEALRAINLLMEKKIFGSAGETVVIEDFLEGEEVSFMVLTNGEEVIVLPMVQDHKPLYNGDEGPNTGGMGACGSVPVITKESEKEIMDKIVYPTLKGLRTEGIIYRGVLYVGLMITSQGPKVLEFNCRFGDPEMAVISMLMESDIVPILAAIANGGMSLKPIKWKKGMACCVVMASGWYVRDGVIPEIGKEITGLDKVAKMENVKIFHSGTVFENNAWKTNGGRVLEITAYDENGIPEAIKRVYGAVSRIYWGDEYHRTDIGRKVLKHLQLA